MNAQPRSPQIPPCTDPVPIDDFILLLFLVGVILIGYINYKRKNATI